MDPWLHYQIKRYELEQQAAHMQLLQAAARSAPAGPSLLDRASVKFGRILTQVGQRLEARSRRRLPATCNEASM